MFSYSTILKEMFTLVSTSANIKVKITIKITPYQKSDVIRCTMQARTQGIQKVGYMRRHNIGGGAGGGCPAEGGKNFFGVFH